MATKALLQWRTSSASALDEIEAAHAAVRGQGRARRLATQRLTHAYVLLLSAQFQRFCRALHGEAYGRLLDDRALAPAVRAALFAAVSAGRLLDRANPSPEVIARDFRPIVANVWDDLCALEPANQARRRGLEGLNQWRNAIAHHDFTKSGAPSERLPLVTVRTWRRALNGLARALDAAVRAAVGRLVGRRMW